MKKIGILTINDNTNYGNRLQNYALQVYLEKQGHIVETIINDTKTEKLDGKPKKLKKNDSNIIRKINNKLKYYINIRNIKNRKNNFIAFNQKFIKNSSLHIIENNIPEYLKDQYDYFVIGSDQVWNPTFKHMSSIDFAMFSPKEKNISYAASFGISNIEERFLNFYKDGLENITKISVREEEGAEIVNKITGKNAQVVVDPTMLLTENDWETLTKSHQRKTKEKYLFTYFLGEITKERRKFLKRVAKKNNLKIVDVSKYGKYYYVGPSEFVSLIKNAEAVITDSFHACAISLLFKVKFYAMERKDKMESMNSRISTLISKFNLENVFIDESVKNISLKKLVDKKIDEILDTEREKSLNFLKEAIR